MVLKKSKFGGNTGNTLRKSCKAGYKVYPQTAFISRAGRHPGRLWNRVATEHASEEWMKNGIPKKNSPNSLNTCEGVKFSLNKDERWLLPEVLKQEVIDEANNGKCKQDFVKHAKVAVIDTSCGEVSRYGNSIHSYINSVDACYTRKCKSWKGPLVIPFDSRQIDVTYTIEKSIDCKTWPYHTDRTFAFYAKIKEPRQVVQKLDKGNDIRYELNDYIYHKNEIDDVEDFDEVTFETKSHSRQTESLAMFIKPNQHQKGRRKKKKRKMTLLKRSSATANVSITPKTSFAKGNQIEAKKLEQILEVTSGVRNDVELIRPSPSTNGKQRDRTKTFYCKVKNGDVSNEYLVNRFGKQYAECRCQPRRFVIFNRNFKHDEIIMSVEMLREEGTLPKVKITIVNISNDALSCLGQFDEDVLNFEVLVDSFIPTAVDAHKIMNTSEGIVFQNSIIETKFKPIADLIRIDDVCQELFAQRRQNDDGNDLNATCYEADCPICYSSGELTFLTDCAHFACNACWGLYVNTKVESGHYNTLLCPDTDCKQIIDIPTVVSFLESHLVSRYLQKRCELHIQRSAGAKLCPSEDCDGVAVYKESRLEKASNRTGAVQPTRNTCIVNNPCVNCHCKLSWCFSCQEPEHWPSSCIANKKYQLQKKKDSNLLFNSRGNLYKTDILCKACPVCRNPIIKNGGCPSMSCVCGRGFCWNCLSDKCPRFLSGADACVTKAEDVLTFTSLDVVTGGSRKAHLRRKALEFSAALRRAVLLNRKLKVDKICFKFKHVDLKSNVLLTAVRKAITLVISGYKLLDNLVAANVVCQPGPLRVSLSHFMNVFTFLLWLLNTSVDVGGLYKIDIARVQKYTEYVESFLDETSLFRIVARNQDRNLLN